MWRHQGINLLIYEILNITFWAQITKHYSCNNDNTLLTSILVCHSHKYKILNKYKISNILDKYYMPLLFILVVSNIYTILKDLKPYKMQTWANLCLNFMSKTESRMLVTRLWEETGRGQCGSKCTKFQLDVGLSFMDWVHSWWP
jgi:hypothetical protein